MSEVPEDQTQPQDDAPEEKTQTPKDRYDDFVRSLTEREDEIFSMLPSNVSPQKFKNAAISAVKRDPMILNAKPRSLFVAITQAAQDGLLPDGKEGVINAYKGEAKWNPMIAGIRKRARELDNLIIDAQMVYEKDHFIWKQGDDPSIEHTPAKLGTPRGNKIGAYAIFKREDGDILHREVMSEQQIMDVKSQSKQPDGLLWGKFETEAWRKTVARRGIKTVPTSEGLMQIVSRDDDSYSFTSTPEERKALTPPPAPPPAPKLENKSAITLDAGAKKKPEPVPAGKQAETQPPQESRQMDPEMGADEAYQDWLADARKELEGCLNAAAVEELRERILTELKPGDVAEWKERCADRATAVFGGKGK